jgi:NodT family efflux transporter outer membrane factor (OMF) lipoprotein
MRYSFTLSSACLALALSACAAVPELGDIPVLREPASLESAQSLTPQTPNWPTTSWWTDFGDAQLGALIEEALASSPDVAAATARVKVAAAIANQANAALLPSANIDASAGGTQQSRNLGIPPQFIPKGVQDTGRITGSLSFDLDLWGKNRAALAAATSDTDAARVDAEQAKLMLSTGVAAAYAELAQYYMQRDVANSALKVRAATAQLTSDRVAVGVDTRGSLRQAQSRVPAARADIAALDEAIALTQHRIAALLGAGPDRGLTITRPQLTPHETGLPDAVGIDLIGRRPDIVTARLRAEAAEKRIKVARADFYPNINISAIIGLQSLGLTSLFKDSSLYGTGGPAISLPLFDGGRISARYAGARAEYDGAVADYNKTLINALREVADAATSSQATAQRLGQQREALTAAAEASHIAALRYRGGLSTQLPVLAADDFELGVRRAVADLEARRLLLDISLIRALGGGYIFAKTTAGQQ